MRQLVYNKRKMMIEGREREREMGKSLYYKRTRVTKSRLMGEDWC